MSDHHVRTAGSSAGERPLMQRRSFLALAGAAAMAGPGLAGRPALAQAPADRDALIKAANGEGSLTFYSAAPESVAKRVSDAFTAKYGVRAQFLRLASNPLVQRYSAEAQVGQPPADLLFVAGGAGPFLAEGLKQGWLESVAEVGLPVVKSGEFPARFLRDGGALIQIAPWLIVYNTDNLKGDAVPKGWKDLLSPRFKDRIIITDPASADSHLDVWAQVLDTFGPDYFTALRAQNLRKNANAVGAVQSLAAGEGDVQLPSIRALVQGPIDKGAPLDTVLPDPATGVEMFLMLTARAKSKSPNAARLFADYMMSKEGNKVFNSETGSYSIYDAAQLPAGYASPKPGTVARKAEIRKQLGLE